MSLSKLSDFEMPSVTQIVTVLSLLAIGVLAYKLILLVGEVNARKRFVLKSFLKESEEQRKKRNKSYSFLERMISFENYKNHVENQLEEGRLAQSFNSFMLMRIINSSICVAVLLAAGYFLKVSLFYYLSIPVSILVFTIPMKQLRKRKLAYYKQLRLELPMYLASFGVLLNDRTPIDAVRASVDYAGGYLRPYVETLVTEIELYPTDERPYHNFYKGVQVREAQEFMIAFQQMMKVTSENGTAIIDHQIEVMNQLQQETYKEELEDRGDVLDRFIMSMMLPFIMVIMGFLVVMLITTFKQIVSI